MDIRPLMFLGMQFMSIGVRMISGASAVIGIFPWEYSA
jgi:hypothetical protein